MIYKPYVDRPRQEDWIECGHNTHERTMQELTDFRWANDSPTTVSQRKLISKLASYFKIPSNQLRAALDLEAAKESKILRFNLPDNSITDKFYVANLTIKEFELLTPSRFIDSNFNLEYDIMLSNPGGKGATFVVYDDSVLYVLYDAAKLDLLNLGGGGIYLSYPPNVVDKILLPIDTFLRSRYPLPHP